ncbi:clan AA aspartic protease, AF_0612 family [Candidatus Fervidibacteria bacterium JGI MDM2 SSWTFF-3-K9]
MDLQGRMDENGQIWVALTVRGMRSEATIEAIVDTGFTHPLLLPVTIAVPLGLELVDFTPMELADGRLQHFFTFAVTVVIDGREFPTVCLVTETGTPLIGTLFMQSIGATLIAKFAESAVALNVPNA